MSKSNGTGPDLAARVDPFLAFGWPGGEAVDETAPPRGQREAVDRFVERNRVDGIRTGRPGRTHEVDRRVGRLRSGAEDSDSTRPAGGARRVARQPSGGAGADAVFGRIGDGADVALSPVIEASQTGFSKEVLRKEVIQPQVPLRLPCYDLVPITGFIFGACLSAPTTSDAPRFGGLTGGVYKAQEHIHRGSADPRLLAIPASCGRVAARNPN